MRARIISPAFWVDEDVCSVSVPARLLFIGLWQIADREGRLEDRPGRIARLLFLEGVPDLLEELVRASLIERYSADGRGYIHIPGLLRHQQIHPREAGSRLPPPPGQEKASLGKPFPEKASLGGKSPTEAEAEAVIEAVREERESSRGLEKAARPPAGKAVENENVEAVRETVAYYWPMAGVPDADLARRLLVEAGGVDGLRGILKTILERRREIRSHGYLLGIVRSEAKRKAQTLA